MITDEQRAGWQRLCDAATEGPWRNNHFTKDEEGPASNSVVSGLLVVVKSWGFELELLSPKQHKANADFIAAAREALPALLAENEVFRSTIEQLHGPLSIASLEARAGAAEAALEKDRTRIIDGVNGLSDALKRRQWLLTSRGSYEWDDERFVQEFRDAIEEIDKAVEPLRVIGADKSNCPQTTAEVIKSRIDLEAALAAAEAERDRLRSALKSAHDDLVLRANPKGTVNVGIGVWNEICAALEQKHGCQPSAAEQAMRECMEPDKGPKWNGRMNVWIPWEATATSECPVPEGYLCRVRVYKTGETAERDAHSWIWSGPHSTVLSVRAYMVTSIKEQGA
jgi:hypothetical protein